MSTTDPQQQQMIRDAMKAIAERKPGRTKLVYDKTKRTIVAVAAIIRNPADLEIKELAELYCVCPSTIDKVRAGQRSSFVN